MTDPQREALVQELDDAFYGGVNGPHDLADAILSSDWLRERDAQVLRELARTINPGTHECFHMVCHECAVREEREQRREALNARAERLTGGQR